MVIDSIGEISCPPSPAQEEFHFLQWLSLQNLELKASLDELRIAFEVESIQMSNAIGANEVQVVHQVPIDHRSESPKLAAL
jgi:hypothetical protein